MAGTWSESATIKADEAELRVKYAALDSFSKYRRHTHYNTTHRRRQNFYALPQAQWQLLAGPPFNYQAKLNAIDDAIDTNARIADAIVEHSLSAFSIPSDSTSWQNSAKSNDHSKAASTIRQLYRDWSAEGVAERTAAYGPVLADLERLFPTEEERDAVRVLVPGAGLARLLVEVVALGFESEGNELSFHQMMASNFILNGLQQGDEYKLHPWALAFSNQRSVQAQLGSVLVPDVHPGNYLDENSKDKKRHAFDRMGMAAGDFCLLYTQEEYKASFGVVASVYFIDTAPNLMRYVQAVRNVLVDGGYWVNLGPLLWHFEERGPAGSNEEKDTEVDGTDENLGYQSRGIADPGSVELTAEEVILVIEHMGFEVLEHEIREQPQGYISDPQSMSVAAYRVLHFVARRKSRSDEGAAI